MLTVRGVSIIQDSGGGDPGDVDMWDHIAQDIDHAVMIFNPKLDATIAKFMSDVSCKMKC